MEIENVNPLLSIKQRLKNLTDDEKRIIKAWVYAFENAISYQEALIASIPDSPHLQTTEIKSETLDDRLTFIKSYEAMIEFFESI